MAERPAGARLLPWPSRDGGPAYLPAHGAHGPVAALADEIEAAQLATGAEVLRCARPLMADPNATARELRFTACRLAECLTDALRIADSRGARLTEQG
ncbi:hypothetical protein RM780_18605 [Streptomyces sp. DSM 44917]|uniref:Uncharacterized protein n=1 Tax=Streptomyces boetiae TaxID=3075541 RepID=A0ABU2LBK1_9ACTN|nr:hypothetical protein [Streptomyces sp. DSM 44917]MDT0308958.1 hypothetical protein [Streptomyces sp. DSM 44917]